MGPGKSSRPAAGDGVFGTETFHFAFLIAQYSNIEDAIDAERSNIGTSWGGGVSVNPRPYSHGINKNHVFRPTDREYLYMLLRVAPLEEW